MCVIFVKVIFVIFKNKNTFHLYKEYIYKYIYIYILYRTFFSFSKSKMTKMTLTKMTRLADCLCVF